ncbi:M23 family metallopeptidase [Alginatibacterium sediminis]|nr:peptidoglycan DD-metalloendopeptidase family protein [Alginatibacterium sediminis]
MTDHSVYSSSDATPVKAQPTQSRWPIFSLFVGLIAIMLSLGSKIQDLNQQVFVQEQQLREFELNGHPEVSELEQQYQTTLRSMASSIGRLQAQMASMQSQKVDQQLLDHYDPEQLESDLIAMRDSSTQSVSELGWQLIALDEQLFFEQNRQLTLETWAKRLKIQQESEISGWPSPRDGVWLTSPFGNRVDPFTGNGRFHRGVDIAGATGTEILAVGGGIVTWSGFRAGYGKIVEIEHGLGTMTRYAHAQEVIVKRGDVIAKGDVVATMGSTGRSTGPHVHFEVIRNGEPVNPAEYLNRAG